MTLETGFILTIVIMTLGGVGMAGFLIWLKHRDSELAISRTSETAHPALQSKLDFGEDEAKDKR